MIAFHPVLAVKFSKHRPPLEAVKCAFHEDIREQHFQNFKLKHAVKKQRILFTYDSKLADIVSYDFQISGVSVLVWIFTENRKCYLECTSAALIT